MMTDDRRTRTKQYWPIINYDDDDDNDDNCMANTDFHLYFYLLSLY